MNQQYKILSVEKIYMPDIHVDGGQSILHYQIKIGGTAVCGPNIIMAVHYRFSEPPVVGATVCRVAQLNKLYVQKVVM